MEITKLEKEIWHKIDEKNSMKNKIEAFESVYNTIQSENKRYAKTHNGSRIPELSRIAGPLFQTIGHFKRELKAINPEKALVALI